VENDIFKVKTDQVFLFEVVFGKYAHRGAATFSKLGVQFLGLGYYYPSTEKLDRSAQFGAVGYIITVYLSKSYVKSSGSVQILGRSRPPTEPPLVAPMYAQHVDMAPVSNTVSLQFNLLLLFSSQIPV